MGKEERERGERAREKAFLCARLVDAYKAQRVVILEVGKMCAFADYFVICHGQSTRQVQGIAHHLEEEMKNLRAVKDETEIALVRTAIDL